MVLTAVPTHVFCVAAPLGMAIPMPTVIVPVKLLFGAQPVVVMVYAYVPWAVGVPPIVYVVADAVPVVMPVGADVFPLSDNHVIKGVVPDVL
jgi:hypothetical protein